MFEEMGMGLIPCERCGKSFLSYAHQSSGGDTYDNLCVDCEISNHSPLEVRQGIERILTAYNLGILDWQMAKSHLRAEGFKIKERGDKR